MSVNSKIVTLLFIFLVPQQTFADRPNHWAFQKCAQLISKVADALPNKNLKRQKKF